MRWTSVALAACVVPALTGCGSLRRGSTDGGLHLARRDAAAEYRRDAETAWDGLRLRHSGRGFSDDFRDGFLDGYADFCDRGAGCEAPPVPPVPYARYKRFFGRGGTDLVRDYYAGFQHGADTASVGSRPTAPAPAEAPRVMPPKPADMPPPKQPDLNKFSEPKKKGSDDPPLLPPPAEGASKSGSLPKPELPVIKPFNPNLSAGGKFAPLPVPVDVERVPPPFPPLPVAEALVAPIPVPTDSPKLSVAPSAGPVPIPVPVYKVPASSERSPLDPVAPLPLRHAPK